MGRTLLRGEQVLDGGIQRADLDVTTAGSAVIRKVIQGTNVKLSSTGVDAGTGDVTLNVPFVAPRVYSTTVLSTLTPNIELYDMCCLTAQNSALTIANPSGVAVNGQTLLLRIYASGSGSVGLTWGTGYRGIGMSLPVNSAGAAKTCYFLLIYNSADSKWDLIATAVEG